MVLGIADETAPSLLEEDVNMAVREELAVLVEPITVGLSVFVDSSLVAVDVIIDLMSPSVSVVNKIDVSPFGIVRVTCCFVNLPEVLLGITLV